MCLVYPINQWDESVAAIEVKFKLLKNYIKRYKSVLISYFLSDKTPIRSASYTFKLEYKRLANAIVLYILANAIVLYSK
jgi:hypothetical protein